MLNVGQYIINSLLTPLWSYDIRWLTSDRPFGIL